MNNITSLQRLSALEADLREAEHEETQAQHEVIDAQAWAVKMKRRKDEALAKVQAFKKQYDL